LDKHVEADVFQQQTPTALNIRAGIGAPEYEAPTKQCQHFSGFKSLPLKQAQHRVSTGFVNLLYMWECQRSCRLWQHVSRIVREA
jgi:hypothetical protein